MKSVLPSVTETIRRPRIARRNPRATVSTSGSSGMGRRDFKIAHRQARRFPYTATVQGHAIFAGGGNEGTGGGPTGAVDIYTDTLPAPVLSGILSGGAGGIASVTLRNSGDAALADTYSINIYASPARTLRGAVLLSGVTVASPLAAGGSVQVTLPTGLPATTPAGSYHILAAVAESSGRITSVAVADAVFRVLPARGNEQTSKLIKGALTTITRASRNLT